MSESKSEREDRRKEGKEKDILKCQTTKGRKMKIILISKFDPPPKPVLEFGSEEGRGRRGSRMMAKHKTKATVFLKTKNEAEERCSVEI